MLDAREEISIPRGGPLRDYRDSDVGFACTLPDIADDDGPGSPRRRGGYRFRLSGRPLQVPKSTWGRVFSAVAFLALAGIAVAAFLAVRSFFLRDPRFTVASSSAIESTGNVHVGRSQLLSVFGEDVERNIFKVPLAARRSELESLPWVQHATVMRLLPNRIRVLIVERTPVAFTRQGSQIGMVDASGVLLDMPPDAPGDPHYSFPVVTGMAANDPLSTRAARMRIYAAFTGDLDSTGEHISEKLSEVDLSNPEDVKALIPEGPADILVHFGETDFLARYRRFEAHLHEWLTDHPRLASVDMRYQRQVVLEMKPESQSQSVAANTAATAPASAKSATASVESAPKPASSIIGKPPSKPRAVPTQSAKAAPVAAPVSKAAVSKTEEWHMVVIKPHTKAAEDLAKARLAHIAPTQVAPTHDQAAPR